MPAGKLTMISAGKGRKRKVAKVGKYLTVYKKKPTFKQKVLRLINKNVETQQLTQTIYDSGNTSLNFFNSGISGLSDIYDVLPSVSRANNAASYQREGDKIMPTFCKLRFNLSLSGGQPVHAYLFVLMDKQNKDANNRTSDTYQILNLNGVNTSFDGSWVNSGFPVDTERFKVIARKRIKLYYDQQPSGAGTASTDNTTTFKEMSVTIPMQKYIKQLDYYGYPSTSNQPKNCNMFWAIGYVNLDTTTESSVGRLRVTCVSTLYFKDA